MEAVADEESRRAAVSAEQARQARERARRQEEEDVEFASLMAAAEQSIIEADALRSEGRAGKGGKAPKRSTEAVMPAFSPPSSSSGAGASTGVDRRPIKGTGTAAAAEEVISVPGVLVADDAENDMVAALMMGLERMGSEPPSTSRSSSPSAAEEGAASSNSRKAAAGSINALPPSSIPESGGGGGGRTLYQKTQARQEVRGWPPSASSDLATAAAAATRAEAIEDDSEMDALIQVLWAACGRVLDVGGVSPPCTRDMSQGGQVRL